MQDTIFTGRLRALALVLVAATLAGCGSPREEFAMVPDGGGKPVVAPAATAAKAPAEGHGGRC